MKHVVALLGALVVVLVTPCWAGDVFTEGNLKPQAMARVELPAQAHKELVIRVTGNAGDLDCYLYHDKDPGMAFGKFVARDTSSKDGCDLRVKPTKDETYTLLVQNTSDHDEHYAVTAR